MTFEKWAVEFPHQLHTLPAARPCIILPIDAWNSIITISPHWMKFCLLLWSTIKRWLYLRERDLLSHWYLSVVLVVRRSECGSGKTFCLIWELVLRALEGRIKKGPKKRMPGRGQWQTWPSFFFFLFFLPRTNRSLLAPGDESTSELGWSPLPLWAYKDIPILQLRKESKALGCAVTCPRFNRWLRVGAVSGSLSNLFARMLCCPARIQGIPFLPHRSSQTLNVVAFCAKCNLLCHD